MVTDINKRMILSYKNKVSIKLIDNFMILIKHKYNLHKWILFFNIYNELLTLIVNRKKSHKIQ